MTYKEIYSEYYIIQAWILHRLFRQVFGGQMRTQVFNKKRYWHEYNQNHEKKYCVPLFLVF